MMLKSLLAATGFAAAASAILLPPELSASDLKISEAIAEHGMVSEEFEVKEIALECPGCPVRFVNGEKIVEEKVEAGTHLDLTFEVSKSAAHDRLLVNGFELYPDANPMRGPFKAPIRANSAREQHQPSDKKFTRPNVYAAMLGYGLQTRSVAKEPAGDLELIELDLQIFEVADEFVSGIPDVKITILTQGSDMAIQSVKQVESQTAVAVEGQPKPECKTMMCSWIEFAKEKLAKLKAWQGCHGKKVGAHHHHKGKGHHGHHGQGANKVDGHHKMHHGHHPYRERTWGQLFKRIAAHILLPVLIGIAAGISVSLVGMLVGTVIVSTWRFFFRSSHRHRHHHRRHHSGHSHKASTHEAAVTEEKAGLMAEQDAPPAYEDSEEQKPDAEA